MTQTVVRSVKSANSRYGYPDRADSRSNVLLITANDRRRRPASAALASRQGHCGISELTHTRHFGSAISNHAHTRTCTVYVSAHTHTHKHAQGLSLSYFIKVPAGVHMQTDRHALRQYRGNVSSTKKVFHYLSSYSPECSTSTHWMNWFVSFGDNVTVSVLS